jgi:hypothetical protein
MRTMWCAAIAVAMTSGAMSTAHAWSDASEKDQLTGAKIPIQEVLAKDMLRQFGQPVKVGLIVKCTNPYNDPKKYRNEDYYQPVLWFGRPVGFVDTTLRYSFDKGEPVTRSYTVDGRGKTISLWFGKDDDFVEQLRKSKTLRIQYDFPWSGNGVMEFNIAGGDEALKKVPCGR